MTTFSLTAVHLLSHTARVEYGDNHNGFFEYSFHGWFHNPFAGEQSLRFHIKCILNIKIWWIHAKSFIHSERKRANNWIVKEMKRREKWQIHEKQNSDWSRLKLITSHFIFVYLYLNKCSYYLVWDTRTYHNVYSWNLEKLTSRIHIERATATWKHHLLTLARMYDRYCCCSLTGIVA